MFPILKKKKVLSRARQEGFALLYSILLTGAILTVGVILMNIITKQLIYSSLSRQSELAYYYAANSGRECLTDAIDDPNNLFYKENRDRSKRTLKNSVSLTCLDQSADSITLNNNDGVFTSSNDVDLVDGNGTKVNLVVYVNLNCLRGESTCTGTSLREKNTYVAIATGYSGNGGDRSVKRSAIYILH